MDTMLSITIPFPPSWNDKNAPKKPLQVEVERMLNGKKLDKLSLYSIHIHVYHDWIKTNGKPVKRDVINYAKVAEDAVMRALGVDDSHNFRIVTDKRYGVKPQVRIIIRRIGPIGQHPHLPPEGA